ncbi:hypothetical protein K435DRAFT_294399 [Dendrothele bispora CBS 962.96]|uniref:Serine-threonine/tyrosine-protein kinase catalytic domain-containing protein n=1 Tax=Dendrothele bispora (strain CBS 962.96) TaxID=1314807 RepID=A0A4S8ML57_DENBC|nr:hypothetical protein K435DRAFT_294399 [Dendrothele bispora CBS 962.96]
MDAGVIIDVTRGKRPERPQGSDVWCPDNIWDLVECCWAQEPRNRPHAYEVKRFLDFLRREKGQEKRVRLREWYLYSYSQSEESLAVLGADSIGIDLDIDQRSMKTVLYDGASMLLSTIKAGSVGDGGDDAQQSPSITTYPGTQNALSKEAASSSNSLMQPEEMIKNLEDRVRDWKGYSLESFGLPLLQGVFDITENMSDARYHVFLFERVLLCLEKSNPWKRLSPILEESSLTPEITPTQSLNETSPLWTLRRAIFLFNVALMQRDADSLVISLQEDNGADFFILHCADAAQRDLWQSTITELTVGDSVTRFIRDALFDAVDADTEEDEEKTSSLQESHTKEVPVPGSWLHLYRDGDGLNDDDHAGRLSPSSVLGSIMDLPDLDLDILPLSAGGTDTSSMWSDHWHEDVNNVDHNYNTSAIKVAGSSGNNFNADLMEEMFYSSIPYSEPSPPKYRERPMVRFELGAEGRKLDDAVTTPLHTKSASMVSGWEPWDKETEERTNDLSLSTVMGTILNKAWRMGR